MPCYLTDGYFPIFNCFSSERVNILTRIWLTLSQIGFFELLKDDGLFVRGRINIKSCKVYIINPMTQIDKKNLVTWPKVDDISNNFKKNSDPKMSVFKSYEGSQTFSSISIVFLELLSHICCRRPKSLG